MKFVSLVTIRLTIFSQNSGKLEEWKVCKISNFGIIDENDAGERIDLENKV